MSFYRTGTISLTNGSAAITGTGTDFISGAAIGECVQAPDGKLYEISTINSATSLTLAQVYLGSTASGQSYSIVPTQSYIRDLAAQAATLVNNYSTTQANAFLVTVADKTTPVDTDRMAIKDVTTGLGKWVTFANVKAFFKTYFDTLSSQKHSPNHLGRHNPWHRHSHSPSCQCRQYRRTNIARRRGCGYYAECDGEYAFWNNGCSDRPECDLCNNYRGWVIYQRK